nr:hypothetical protein [Pandoravirus belohorizontensis]
MNKKKEKIETTRLPIGARRLDGVRALVVTSDRQIAATHRTLSAKGGKRHCRAAAHDTTAHLPSYTPSMFKFADRRASSPTVAGPDGRRWFAAHDDEAGWKRFASQHKSAAGSQGLPRTQHFCAANEDMDLRNSGPVERLFELICSKPYSSTYYVRDACSRSGDDRELCFADAMRVIDGDPPLRPIMPVDYAETVAARSGIALKADPSAAAFVSTVEDARLCVLVDRMGINTPLREAIRGRCRNSKMSDFEDVYVAARAAGGSTAAALHAAGLIKEK